MSIKILMPALSPTMTEGNLANWLVKEGDKVEAGDMIAEIETDKATMEVEAIDEGVVAKIIVESGSKDVAVNSVIMVLAEEGEDIKSINIDELIAENDVNVSGKNEIQDKVIEISDSKIKDIEKTNSAKNETKIQENTILNKQENTRIFASPLAKRLIKEKKLDINVITGTGPKGRIIKNDVLNALKSKSLSTEMFAPKRQNITEPFYEEKEVSTVRGVIAKRLTESKQNVPHFYVSRDIEIDNLLKARSYLNSENQSNGNYKISVNDMIIKATAVALKKVPEANVSWNGKTIKHYKSADISVAVAVDDGLITPIIRDADYKSLINISNEMKTLVKKAKENKLKPEEFQGGSISVSNLGMFGTDNFKAIINPPQACILAIGAGVEKALSKNGKIYSATVMNITISVDHRAVDGAVAASFLNALKESLEEPVSLFL